MTLPGLPALKVSIAFDSVPLAASYVWTDVTADVRVADHVTINRGRPSELDTFQPGTATLTLNNRARRYDPRYVSEFMTLPGAAGSYFSTPNAAPVQIVGDICMVAKIAPVSWTPATRSSIISKYLTTGNNRSYRFLLNTSGTLEIGWSTDGTAASSKASSANLSALPPGSAKWVAVTLDVDNGASSNSARFWTSDDGTAWTQLGATQTSGAVTSIANKTGVLEVGTISTGTAEPFSGAIYVASVRSGIGASGTVGGTQVAIADAAAAGADLTATTWVAATGETWTENGTITFNAPYYGKLKPGKPIKIEGVYGGATGAGTYVEYIGFIDSWPQVYVGANRDAVVPLTAYDATTLLARLVQPDPVFVYTLSTIGSCVLFLRNFDGTTWFDESGFGRHATRSADVNHSATTFGTTALKPKPKRNPSHDVWGGSGGVLLYGGFPSPAPAGINGTAAISTSLGLGLTSPSVVGGRFTIPTITLGTTYTVSFWLQSSMTELANEPSRSVFILGGNEGGTTVNAAISSAISINGFDTGQGVATTVSAPGVSAYGDPNATGQPNDGHPHHVVFVAAPSDQRLYFDGVQVATSSTTPTSATLATIDLDEYVAATTFPYGVTLDTPPVANTAVQDVTAWSKALSAAEVYGLYQRGIGQLAESTWTRFNRLLDGGGFPSGAAWRTGANSTDAYGTCLDYTPAFQSTLDALNEVGATEQGKVYVTRDGKAAMGGRYWTETTYATAAVSFADDGTGAAYMDIATDYSTREVQNDITVYATEGVSANASDATSDQDYGPQPATIGTLLPSTVEAGNMATGLLALRKDPQTRLSRPIQFSLRTIVETQRAATLGVDIGSRVSLKLTPMRTVGAQISQALTIEGISWDISDSDWIGSFDLAPIASEAAGIASSFFVLDSATRGVLGANRLGY